MLLCRRPPHPLVLAVLAFTGGIACAAGYQPSSPFLFFLLLLLCALSLFFCWLRDSPWQLPLLLVFWCACGLLHGSARLHPPGESFSLYRLFATDREVTLAGTLLQAPAVFSDKTSLLVQAEAYLAPEFSAALPPENAAISGDLYAAAFKPAQGKIELSLKGPPPENLSPGQKLLVRAYVSRPKPLSTPGAFDYQQFLAQQSIWVTGWISSPAHIAPLPRSEEQPPWRKLRFLPEQLRFQINTFITSSLSPRQSSLYKAILTGDRASLSPETLENFKATGAMDLLSISGLHMGLIAIGLGLVINFLLKRSAWLLIHTPAWKIAVVLIMPILCGYAFIAGLQTPVVRALIMTSVFLLAVLFDRQWHIPTNIAIAAFILLLINPASLFTVSFQLSFAAIISLAAIMPLLAPLLQKSDDNDDEGKNRSHSLIRKISLIVKGGLIVSLAALAGILPLLLFYFNRFSLLFPVSTLLIEPLLCFWALPVGLISIPFLFFAPEVARFLLPMGGAGLEAADNICAWFAGLPFHSLWLPTPFPLEIICYYALLFSLLNVKKIHAARYTAGLSITILLVTPAYSLYRQSHEQADTVSILDVGQGNAVVIELAGGYTALLDGGGPYSPRYNVGERVIAPFLWGKRIRRLDAVIISHPDADHCNGLAFIIKRFRPGTVWINGDDGANENYAALLDIARGQDTTIRVPHKDESLFQNSRSHLFNLAGLHEDDNTATGNDKSLMIKLTSQGNNFLFTGDISEYAEKKLVTEKNPLHAEVLLLAHHGSSSSTSASFLARVSPAHAVISAGSSKKKIFPAPEVMKRCAEAGCLIYNTARDGAITFKVKNGKLLASRMIVTHP
ncbi:MAG: DNA internalization-related competence protein ComEC/Rec2 [Deltaproteobacteria bacterium]|nr:DNA internalization-related competence protein ComEC/Rec2 [Deltaproteobacteria bacterium]